MGPTIWCVRHAQGVHNLSMANHVILDPLLTSRGEKQCRTLADVFPRQKTIKAILASPLRRTLYTALLAFQPALDADPDLKVTAFPELQETSDVPCDTGSDLEALKEEIESKELRVDLTLVPQDWNDKRMDTKWAPSSSAIMARGAEGRKWLRDTFKNVDGDVVLVSHGGFLHYFTEDWEDSGVYNGTGWANTEYRSYTFTDEAEAHLIETAESRAQRGKSTTPPDREMQKGLLGAAMRIWQGQGLQNPSQAGVEKPADAKPADARL